MTFDKIKELIVEQLGVEEDVVTPEANIQDDLGADSLDIVDLIQTIEDEYDLSIPDEAIEEIKTVNDIDKAGPGDLGNTLRIGYLLRMKRKHYILLVYTRKRNECIRILNSLFKKKFRIGSVTVDDSSLGKQFVKKLASSKIFLYYLDAYALLDKYIRQIIRRSSASDYHRIFDGIHRESDALKEIILFFTCGNHSDDVSRSKLE